MLFYIERQGKLPEGPFRLNELRRLVAQGKLDPELRLSMEGDDTWRPLRRFIPDADKIVREGLPAEELKKADRPPSQLGLLTHSAESSQRKVGYEVRTRKPSQYDIHRPEPGKTEDRPKETAAAALASAQVKDDGGAKASDPPEAKPAEGSKPDDKPREQTKPHEPVKADDSEPPTELGTDDTERDGNDKQNGPKRESPQDENRKPAGNNTVEKTFDNQSDASESLARPKTQQRSETDAPKKSDADSEPAADSVSDDELDSDELAAAEDEFVAHGPTTARLSVSDDVIIVESENVERRYTLSEDEWDEEFSLKKAPEEVPAREVIPVNLLAAASLFLGIASLFANVITGVPGLICALLGRQQALASEEDSLSPILAMVGLITSALGITIFVIWLVAYAGFAPAPPRLLTAWLPEVPESQPEQKAPPSIRHSAVDPESSLLRSQERRSLDRVREIGAAVYLYSLQKGRGRLPRNLQQLVDEGYLDGDLLVSPAAPQRRGQPGFRLLINGAWPVDFPDMAVVEERYANSRGRRAVYFADREARLINDNE